MREVRTGLAIVLLTGLLTRPAAADVRSAAAPAWGSATTVQTIQAFAFLPAASTEPFVVNNGGLSCAGSPCTFVAPLFLQAGALVSAIQAEVCDFDGDDNPVAVLYRVAAPGGEITVIATAQTVGTPGCILVSGSPTTPETIDNMTYSYAIQVNMGDSAATRLHGVRVFYALQVSLPQAPSFSDVPPTHPYYRFVEALVASGITAGCGGGLYCVNNPITRGEMAVFLSAALGLHFAP